MKRLRFHRGSAFIDVKIKDRTITYVSPIMNLVPLIINLDKLDEQKDKIKKMNLDKEALKELANLKTEEEMEIDLIKDLRKSGWRHIKYGSS